MTSNGKTISVDNLVLEGVLRSLETSHQWRGTMTELDSILARVYSRSQTKINNLPGSPSALRVVINRIANRLRARGVSVRFGRANDRIRTRFVKFVSR